MLIKGVANDPSKNRKSRLLVHFNGFLSLVFAAVVSRTLDFLTKLSQSLEADLSRKIGLLAFFFLLFAAFHDPEFQPLTHLCTIFDRKGKPFVYLW